MRALLFAAASLLGAAACLVEPLVVPSTVARPSVAEVAGVRVTVDGMAWRGAPVDLGARLTPLYVALENHAGRPLRVTYADLTLVGASGFTYPALVPFTAQAPVSVGDTVPGLTAVDYHPAVTVRAPPPRIHHRHFFVAPHHRLHFPGWTVWLHAFPPYPPTYVAPVWPARLPSDDMLAEALPEGVVADGGQVVGFVYFAQQAQREQAIRFRMAFVDASDGARFGQIELPLALRAP